VNAARVLVVGGAGFIGSHVVARLLATEGVGEVVVFDNLSSGSRDRLPTLGSDDRLELVEGDVKDLDALTAAAQAPTCASSSPPTPTSPRGHEARHRLREVRT
jgi:UDP-glucose 4-epimerase